MEKFIVNGLEVHAVYSFTNLFSHLFHLERDAGHFKICSHSGDKYTKWSKPQAIKYDKIKKELYVIRWGNKIYLDELIEV